LFASQVPNNAGKEPSELTIDPACLAALCGELVLPSPNKESPPHKKWEQDLIEQYSPEKGSSPAAEVLTAKGSTHAASDSQPEATAAAGEEEQRSPSGARSPSSRGAVDAVSSPEDSTEPSPEPSPGQQAPREAGGSPPGGVSPGERESFYLPQRSPSAETKKRLDEDVRDQDSLREQPPLNASLKCHASLACQVQREDMMMNVCALVERQAGPVEPYTVDHLRYYHIWTYITLDSTPLLGAGVRRPPRRRQDPLLLFWGVD